MEFIRTQCTLEAHTIGRSVRVRCSQQPSCRTLRYSKLISSIGDAKPAAQWRLRDRRLSCCPSESESESESESLHPCMHYDKSIICTAWKRMQIVSMVEQCADWCMGWGGVELRQSSEVGCVTVCVCRWLVVSTGERRRRATKEGRRRRTRSRGDASG